MVGRIQNDDGMWENGLIGGRLDGVCCPTQQLLEDPFNNSSDEVRN